MEEAERRQALYALQVLDTPEEAAFDNLTRLAAEAFKMPIATISLVDAERQWLKSSVGGPAKEIARADSFCHHTIEGEGLMVVEDAAADPRFRSNPMVDKPGGVRFYAGAPVRLSSGAKIGAVCVMGPERRGQLAPDEQVMLKTLASAASSLFELRREVEQRREAEARLEERVRLLDLAERLAGVGHWRLTCADNHLFMSPAVMKVLGADDPDPATALEQALDAYLPSDRAMLQAHLARAISTGEGYHFEARLRRGGDGALREVRGDTVVEFGPDGQVEALIGVMRDVTDENRAMAILSAARVKAEADSARLHRLATTDVLTDLPNRRAFIERTEAVLSEAAGDAVALAVLDLDHFKSINDRFGHDAGDEVLRSFAHLCQEELHGAGSLGRLGGEEFALLLTGTAAETAVAACERLRSALATAPVILPGGDHVWVTFSAGLAYARPEESWRALFSRADEALYRAKRSGRDRLQAA